MATRCSLRARKRARRISANSYIRGIAYRHFKQTFNLADHVKVVGASRMPTHGGHPAELCSGEEAN
jgi:HSP20 family molecular chaperone IbpA